STPSYPTRRPSMGSPTSSNIQAGPGPSTQSSNPRFKTSKGSSEDTVAKSAQTDPQTYPSTFRISREERDRRMNEGLCIRCGGRGHFGKQCKTHQH
ncbi:hypothetical protein K435DRAFT_593226, partial [Dendrothele bispora CBS 962.96]